MCQPAPDESAPDADSTNTERHVREFSVNCDRASRATMAG
jgi:hypothetical protein